VATQTSSGMFVVASLRDGLRQSGDAFLSALRHDFAALARFVRLGQTLKSCPDNCVLAWMPLCRAPATTMPITTILRPSPKPSPALAGRPIIARATFPRRACALRNKCREERKKIPAALPKASAQRSGASHGNVAHS
jgi:hypothetical protein